MGNIQLQVVNEIPRKVSRLSNEVIRVSAIIDVPDYNNAALLVKNHCLSFINGSNRVFQALTEIFEFKF